MDTYMQIIKDIDDLLAWLPPHMLGHSRRVAVCSSIICECARSLRPNDMPYKENVALAAYLGGICHDVGKLMLPIPLTSKADYMMHPVIGAKLLSDNIKALTKNEIQARIILETIRHHHERADGGGFPDGLKAKDIPLTAGICAIANKLDYRLCQKDVYIGEVAGILGEFKSQTGSTFTESALICLEQAWPRLMEWYVKWTGREVMA